ncbi:HNH DNAse [Vibrio phage VpV262]|uniref:HNH DNAse n=1 Tax=Vibrio phage VpV262 TaxID=2907796 RepID=Q8LT34_9CAUD|nr:HNH endonuclease [Vibrio phage VpV262]AAM28379.1 HNH DNAse [Vibrio phage VpV262]
MGRVTIEGYDGYLVDSQGYVVSKRTGKRIYECSDKRGYRRVRLYRGDGGTTYLVHRLVAQAFIPNPDGLGVVNHKDAITHHNHVENLEWCTQQYNVEYAIAKVYTFVSPTGEKVQLTNLEKFCAAYALDSAHMNKVHSGTRQSHKGWTAYV